MARVIKTGTILKMDLRHCFYNCCNSRNIDLSTSNGDTGIFCHDCESSFSFRNTVSENIYSTQLDRIVLDSPECNFPDQIKGADLTFNLFLDVDIELQIDFRANEVAISSLNCTYFSEKRIIFKNSIWPLPEKKLIEFILLLLSKSEGVYE